jgi:predicted RNA-binding Zn-ribbon protein involved in translation (DUF1610 family)
VVASHDVVVYEDLQVKNLVKNHHLAKSIQDAGWSQFTQWLDYYGKIWDKAVVAVPPQYTTQDCSNCGHRVPKALSTRTHVCSKCGCELDRDQNASKHPEEGTKHLGNGMAKQYLWAKGNWGEIPNDWGDKYLCYGWET